MYIKYALSNRGMINIFNRGTRASVLAAGNEVLTRKPMKTQAKIKGGHGKTSIFQGIWVLRVAETHEMTFVQHWGIVWDNSKSFKKFLFFDSTFFHKC